MNKVKQLDTLLAHAEEIANTKTESVQPVKQDPFSKYTTKVPPVKVVNVDVTQYNKWLENINQFLTDNDLTGFIAESYISIRGNYVEFEEQYELLKRLKRLDAFLGTKLTFKSQDMEFYVLRALSTNSKADIEYLDILAQAVGNADVRDTLVNLQRAQMLNIRFSYGSNGHISYDMPVDSDKFLSLRGRERLAELQKSKLKKTLERVVKNIWKWFIALIFGGGLIVYFVISSVNNHQSNSALNNTTIINSNLNVDMSNDVYIAPSIKGIK